MRVDVHSHFTPPRFFEEMDRRQAQDRVEAFSVYGPMLGKNSQRRFAKGEQAFIDGLVEQMDGAGVDVAIFSMGAVQPYFSEEADAKAGVRFANDMLVDAVTMGGGRMAAFGSVPLPHTAAAIDEMAYCLDECGFAGINLGCSADGKPLDHPMFDDFWAAANDRGTAVFLHPGTTPNMAVGSADFHLAPDFCSPTELAVALCRLVVTKVTTRFPRIQFIAAGMGGTIPYLARRFDRGLAQTHPDLHEELGGVVNQLQRFWYDTSMIEDDRVLDVVRHSVGVDRLVLGSDIPRGPLSDVVDFISTSARLSDVEKTHILDRSAAGIVRVNGAHSA
ncbi:amidohydrolase family protein [Streptomyces blattellae]|uniref:amidohydrolase family protein n=1 Tax=Streptomyces blattellae TaxID=2569855 RepID=UPI0012B6F23E|nr:amidohydrolase family protein [Streptomyces blattellae]